MADERERCARCGQGIHGIISWTDGTHAFCDACIEIQDRAETAQRLATLAHWRYDPARLVLVHRTPSHAYDYEVDPERCRTAAETLDWIAQVANKTWAEVDPACIGELVLALNILLGLQERLCGSGLSKRITPRKVLLARHAELGLT